MRLAVIILACTVLGCETESAAQSDVGDSSGRAVFDSEPIQLDAGLDRDSAGGGEADSSATVDPVPDTDMIADMGVDAGLPDDCRERAVFASEVISFEPGSNAGYGQRNMPDVVLGPPQSGLPTSGALDVVSLGAGGEITLGFGDWAVFDGPGPDFIVWENPFWVGGDESMPFAELGEVSVSSDGEQWVSFPCDPLREDGFDSGCAGWRPRMEFDLCTLDVIGPEAMGGDIFDLAELQLDSIRYVRIRDLSESGRGMAAGFDLDAVGVIHAQ